MKNFDKLRAYVATLENAKKKAILRSKDEQLTSQLLLEGTAKGYEDAIKFLYEEFPELK